MYKRKFADIGANLVDPMFSGIYNNSKKHIEDLNSVISRAYSVGIEKIIVTTGSISEVQLAQELIHENSRFYFTVGCHPTRCLEFDNDPDVYYGELQKIIKMYYTRIAAVGECGLDYDREEFCPRDIQKKYFKRQLSLSKECSLPLFIHCRNAHSDLVSIVQDFIDKYGPVKGVVHTFDGNLEQMDNILNLGLSLGFNGCSLKSEENLKVAASAPLDKIILETDAPWCEIRPTHAGYRYVKTKFAKRKPNKWDANSMVTGRNEPACIVQVLEVLAAVRGADEDELANTIYENSLTLFPHLMNIQN